MYDAGKRANGEPGLGQQFPHLTQPFLQDAASRTDPKKLTNLDKISLCPYVIKILAASVLSAQGPW
jgi:hypothetical protein